MDSGQDMVSEPVYPGSIVDYDAKDCILLNTGFEVQLNAEFNVIIDGCNNGARGGN